MQDAVEAGMVTNLKESLETMKKAIDETIALNGKGILAVGLYIYTNTPSDFDPETPKPEEPDVICWDCGSNEAKDKMISELYELQSEEAMLGELFSLLGGK